MRQYGAITYEEWKARHSVTLEGVKEIITMPIWHRLAYTSGTTTELTFFGVATTGITGNLRLGGQLPNGYEYLTKALSVQIELEPTETAGALPADGLANGAILGMMQMINRGWAELKIGDKPYGEFPLDMLPAGGGTYAMMSNVETGTNATPVSSQIMHANNGEPNINNVYSLSWPLLVPGQYPFTMILRWPTAITHVPAQNPFIKCRLDGEMARPAQ